MQHEKNYTRCKDNIQILSDPKIRETFEALKAEIKGVGASSASDLDDELKKKTNTPNTKVSKEWYEYKNIIERKENKAKRKSW